MRTDDVAGATAQARRGDRDELGLQAEDLSDRGTQAARGGAGVQLGLHDDLSTSEMKATGEPEHGGSFRAAAAGLGRHHCRQL